MLSREIRKRWEETPNYKLLDIVSLKATRYPAYTVKMDNEYGVAITLDSETVEVSERFAGARLYSKGLVIDGAVRNVLLLTTILPEISEPFSTLCAEFVAPGENGQVREKTLENPIEFWQEWKEILGNKNIETRVYDTLGELQTLEYLYKNGFTSAVWRGPDRATYDIDCGDGIHYEVKSSVVTSRREITMHGIRQGDTRDNEQLFIVLCQYQADSSGVSINSLVKDLNDLGYSAYDLNQKLAEKGFEKGQSARDRQYRLMSMMRYVVDSSFPVITEKSFKNDTMPPGIANVSYTVLLDNVPGENLLIIGTESNGL